MEYKQCVYPEALIKKCQKVISGYSGKKVTEDEAELYLDKFARLMKVTIRIMEYEQTKNGKGKN